ncbi:MAG: aromatic amino acid transport family protein [Alphaproteobacteria bacterium]|nr:aromatic amino acid transport family protein [Alphaproteobacteria bacterium]
MQRQLGSIFIVAGTAIGAGMLALPLVLANFGIIYTILLMLATWGLMYYLSLVNLELNLDAGKGLTISQLGRKFSGPVAETIGFLSLKILTYALLAAYIDGGASVIQKILLSFFNIEIALTPIIIAFTTFLVLLFIFATKWVDYTNRIMFFGLIVSFIILLIALLGIIDFNNLPTTSSNLSLLSWRVALPIVFTSFGFHVVFHSLTSYCNNDKIVLKRVFFWGSFIPTIVYILLVFCVLGVLFAKNADYFQQMLQGKAQLGDMILALSQSAGTETILVLSTITSLLAILTSVIGVGLGLKDSWLMHLSSKIKHPHAQTLGSICATFAPPLILVFLIPEAFIKALSFAGLILVIMAILLPLYLLRKSKMKHKDYHYPILRFMGLRFLAAIAGIAIIVCEVINIFS